MVSGRGVLSRGGGRGLCLSRCRGRVGLRKGSFNLVFILFVYVLVLFVGTIYGRPCCSVVAVVKSITFNSVNCRTRVSGGGSGFIVTLFFLLFVKCCFCGFLVMNL